MTDSEQDTRRKHLTELVDTYHRGSFGDYDDRYAEFEGEYLGTIDGEIPTDEQLDNIPATREEWNKYIKPVPKYASVANDETYGMVHLCESLAAAMIDQAGIPSNGEYLNVPAGIYDLDTGKVVWTRTVTLPVDVFNAMCGIVAMTYEGDDTDVLDGGEGVNHQGIFTDWDLIRKIFPLDQFRAWALEHGVEDSENGNGYNRSFGE